MTATPDLRRVLLQELAIVQVGLLGLRDSPLPFRPMVHLLVPDSGRLWFLAETDTDFVRACEGSRAEAVYCLTGRNHDVHACLTGLIRTVPDRQGLQHAWSITAEAQFPGGLADIEWMPMCLTLREADVWRSPESAVLAGMEAIAAALPGERPDRQVHGRLTF